MRWSPERYEANQFLSTPLNEVNRSVHLGVLFLIGKERNLVSTLVECTFSNEREWRQRPILFWFVATKATTDIISRDDEINPNAVR